MAQGCAGRAKLVIGGGVVGVDAQRLPGEAARRGRVAPAVGQRCHLRECRYVVWVAPAQTGPKCIGRLHVSAYVYAFLAPQIVALSRLPVERRRRFPGPAQDIAISGNVLELVAADADAQLPGRSGELHGLFHRLHRCEDKIALMQQFFAVEHLQLVAERPDRRDAYQEPGGSLPADIEHTPGTGADEAFDPLDWQPVFRPRVCGIRREFLMLERGQAAPVGGLVEQPAGLDFDVLTIGIGQQFLPDHPLADSPRSRFSGRVCHLRRSSGHAEVVLVPVAAEELGEPAHDVIRLVAPEIVLLVPREIPALARLMGQSNALPS